MYRKDHFRFIVPEIIQGTQYVKEWLRDAELMENTVPQGTIITTVQTGNIDTFLMKLCERACGSAQLEIMRHELAIKDKFIKQSPYGYRIQEATNGKNAKCQFKNGFCGGRCMLGPDQFDRKI